MGMMQESMLTVLTSDELLSEAQQLIGYTFKDKRLLQQAFTHSSFSKEMEAEKKGVMVKDYERLEFLGDAVLELCTSRMLYDAYDWPEGKLTKTRSKIVCEASLSFIARKLGLGKYLVFSHGEEKTGGRDRDSILCDVVEAIIGAVYLDSDLKTAFELIDRILFSHLGEIPKQRAADYKSNLQEFLQAKGKELPEYVVTKEEGPPHDRIFTISLIYQGKVITSAQGRTKKSAAQEAAKKALAEWRDAWN